MPTLFKRKKAIDFASVTPMGVEGAPQLVAMYVDTPYPGGQVPPTFGNPAQLPVTDRATNLYEQEVFPASLAPFDRRRFRAKRMGVATSDFQPDLVTDGAPWGDTISVKADTFVETETENLLMFQKVNPREVGEAGNPLGPLVSKQSVVQHYEDWENTGIDFANPDKIGRPTDKGRPAPSYVFYEYQRPFDQLSSQRLGGQKGVFGVPTVGEPKMTVNEAVGKFPAPGMTGFATQVPTDREFPGNWYDEESNALSTHVRNRKRF